MLDLTSIFQKSYAKIGLAVTLFAFLAACSHKTVNGEADLNPIPANEIVDSAYTPSTVESTASQSQDVSQDVPVKKAHHASIYKSKKKHVKIAKHKAHHKTKKAAQDVTALAQVHEKLQPPPPSMPSVEASVPAATSIFEKTLPVPALDSVTEAASSEGGRGWMIWALVVGFAVALVVGYRVARGKKGRRLVFNS